MSHLIDDDGKDDFSEQDNEEEDGNFQLTANVYVKKKKKSSLLGCHFCGRKFLKKKDEKMDKNYPKCKTCRKTGVTRRIVLLEKKCAACKQNFAITSHMMKVERNGKKTWKVRCTNCRSLQKAPRGPLPKPGRNYFECDMCGKSFHSRHLIYQHMDNHRTGDDLECKVCHKNSKNRSVLRTHLRSHFEKFICHLCGFIAKTAYTLRNHVTAHEADPTQVLDFSNFVPKSRFDKKPVEKGDYPCRYCGYCFHTITALNSHELRRHQQQNVHEFKCKVCGETFQHTNDLRVHNYTHSTRPLLFCEYPGCSQFFNRIKPLNAHIRNVHKANNISCDICNKKFKMKGSLAKHLKNNRCIPVHVRKVQSGKTVLLGVSKPRKPLDQLEAEANMAKEQFKALGGVLKDDPTKITKKRKEIVKRSEAESSDKNDDDEEWNDDDSLDSSTENSKIEDVKVKVESDSEFIDVNINENPDDPIPLMKIEIKMEPMQQDDDGEFLLHQDNSIFVFDNFGSANIQEEDDYTMNPSVVLEKLDYSTLLQYQAKTCKVKRERVREGVKKRPPRLFQDKYMSQYKQRKGIVNLICDECGLVFNNKHLMKEHVHSHSHKYGKNHCCKSCGEKFFFRESLLIHKNEVHRNKKRIVPLVAMRQDKPFICDMCGNQYNSYQSITGHLKIVHKKTADFCCPAKFCSAKFKTKMYLERHFDDVHQKIMRFQCNFCGKFFKRKHQVKEHEKLHNDPVECSICHKLVRNLKSHVRNIHEIVKKVDKSCCTECGQMVNTYNMQMHIDRIHRKLPIPGRVYPCVECSETFSRSDDLRRHKYTVHLEKPLKPCPFDGCGGIFNRTKALNNHIRNVHRNSQITCQHCNKTFNSESGIRKHLINKHKDQQQQQQQES